MLKTNLAAPRQRHDAMHRDAAAVHFNHQEVVKPPIYRSIDSIKSQYQSCISLARKIMHQNTALSSICPQSEPMHALSNAQQVANIHHRFAGGYAPGPPSGGCAP